MNLRFIERDGKKILQQQIMLSDLGPTHGSITTYWQDVPLVKEPKKAREWWIEPSSDYAGNGAVCRVWPADASMLIFAGKKPDMSKLIKVREVLENE